MDVHRRLTSVVTSGSTWALVKRAAEDLAQGLSSPLVIEQTDLDLVNITPMNDNAPPHNAAAVLDRLREAGIDVTECLPKSPDLNPKESRRNVGSRGGMLVAHDSFSISVTARSFVTAAEDTQRSPLSPPRHVIFSSAQSVAVLQKYTIHSYNIGAYALVWLWSDAMMLLLTVSY
ncbi:hypothetical protein J6590_004817 [Homalodisca vitripennis]|nr:hypothetical protein J6590_004817 [Homalodisca vitripennis]